MFSQFCPGDVRVNQNLGNALFQNLFLRLHNNIASKLFYINQFWTDEILYQETRRIVGAIIQHITYNHYLPLILGIYKFIYKFKYLKYVLKRKRSKENIGFENINGFVDKQNNIYRGHVRRVLWIVYPTNNVL